MFNAKAWSAAGATSPLAATTIPRRDATERDVRIEILYCGICHSDLHTVRDEWHSVMPTVYPCVPGHEIVGRVAAVGSAVTKFKAGDLVGVGCLVDSDGTCPQCQEHFEQFCPSAVFTYNSPDRHTGKVTYGGYSDSVVVDERFVLRVPGNLDLAGAAPLLCAGITTWSPLRHWKVGPGSQVAVVGLGGLGHMGLKLAKALGAEVTLFTRSRGKEADARRLGADRVVLSTEAAQMASVAGRFDLIVDTVPYVHDLNPYIPTLATNGTLVLVGYLGGLEPLLNTVPMVLGRKSVAGSLIGGIPETQELLDFCGEHGLTSDVEVIRMQDINGAYERLLKSDVKYRFVIDMASLKAKN